MPCAHEYRRAVYSSGIGDGMQIFGVMCGTCGSRVGTVVITPSGGVTYQDGMMATIGPSPAWRPEGTLSPPFITHGNLDKAIALRVQDERQKRAEPAWARLVSHARKVRS